MGQHLYLPIACAPYSTRSNTRNFWDRMALKHLKITAFPVASRCFQSGMRLLEITAIPAADRQ